MLRSSFRWFNDVVELEEKNNYKREGDLKDESACVCSGEFWNWAKSGKQHGYYITTEAAAYDDSSKKKKYDLILFQEDWQIECANPC